jgi:hypothetical protein
MLARLAISPDSLGNNLLSPDVSSYIVGYDDPSSVSVTDLMRSRIREEGPETAVKLYSDGYCPRYHRHRDPLDSISGVIGGEIGFQWES